MKIGLVYPNEGKKERAFHVGLASIASYARTIHTDLEFEVLDTESLILKKASVPRQKI